jgi:hypothetical protein
MQVRWRERRLVTIDLVLYLKNRSKRCPDLADILSWLKIGVSDVCGRSIEQLRGFR